MTTFPSGTAKPRILIVDDLPDNIGILSAYLSGRYTILAARNGETALRIAASDSPPDLILLDIMMPGMNGFSVCEILKMEDRTRAIPIVFITAADDIESKTRAFELGAVDYMTKPFEIREVEARVRTHIALVETRKTLERQNRELVEAARLRDDVERMTRHDLKGPLNAIIGLPQMMLLEEGLDPERRESLELILEAGQKMLRMINNSLDLFKMERGLYSPSKGEVDIMKVLGDVRREFAALERSASIEVRILLDGRQAGSTDSRMVVGEELLCFCLLSNLVKNALEASPERGTILVEVAGEGRVTVRLGNEGEVPREIRDSFFGKYVTSGKRHGTGLGTYSAKLMTETLGGSMALDATRAGHTTIIVELPGRLRAFVK